MAKSLSIIHYLSKRSPPRIEQSRLDELTERLLQKDLSVIDEIVQGHMRLAIKLASKYAYNRRQKTDDIISVALLAAVMACHEAAEGRMKEGSCLSDYIGCRIITKLSRFCSEDTIIRIPKSSKDLYGLENIKTQYINQDDRVTHSEEHLIELNEMIDSCIETDTEKTIIALRRLGFSDEEIGERLGCSKAYINKIRSEVRKRFNEKKGIH